MSEQSPVERELAELLVSSLNLEDVAPAQIDPEAPLFGEGLGLDSIDALELALAISGKYGFQLRSDSDENRRIFASLRALAAHIEQRPGRGGGCGAERGGLRGGGEQVRDQRIAQRERDRERKPAAGACGRHFVRFCAMKRARFDSEPKITALSSWSERSRTP